MMHSHIKAQMQRLANAMFRRQYPLWVLKTDTLLQVLLESFGRPIEEEKRLRLSRSVMVVLAKVGVTDVIHALHMRLSCEYIAWHNARKRCQVEAEFWKDKLNEAENDFDRKIKRFSVQNEMKNIEKCELRMRNCNVLLAVLPTLRAHLRY